MGQGGVTAGRGRAWCGGALGRRTLGQGCPQAGQSASSRSLVRGACRGGQGTARTPGVLQCGLHVGPGSWVWGCSPSRRGPVSPSACLEPCPALWSRGAGPPPPVSPRPAPQPSAAPCAPRSPAGLTPGAAPPCPGVSSYWELSQLPRALHLPQNQLCPPTTPRANRASSTPTPHHAVPLKQLLRCHEPFVTSDCLPSSVPVNARLPRPRQFTDGSRHHLCWAPGLRLPESPFQGDFPHPSVPWGVTPPGLQDWGRERGAGRLCWCPQMALTHPGHCPAPQAWHLASCDACDPIELSSWVSRVRAEGTRGTLTVTPSVLRCVPPITAPATRTPPAHSHRPCICQRACKSSCLEGALERWSVVGSDLQAGRSPKIPQGSAPRPGRSGQGKKGKGGVWRMQAWGVGTLLQAPMEAGPPSRFRPCLSGDSGHGVNN